MRGTCSKIMELLYGFMPAALVPDSPGPCKACMGGKKRHSCGKSKGSGIPVGRGPRSIFPGGAAGAADQGPDFHAQFLANVGGGDSGVLGAEGELAQSWSTLVRQCAVASGRNLNNLKCYVGKATLRRQLDCLGEADAKEALEIGTKIELTALDRTRMGELVMKARAKMPANDLGGKAAFSSVNAVFGTAASVALGSNGRPNQGAAKRQQQAAAAGAVLAPWGTHPDAPPPKRSHHAGKGAGAMAAAKAAANKAAMAAAAAAASSAQAIGVQIEAVKAEIKQVTDTAGDTEPLLAELSAKVEKLSEEQAMQQQLAKDLAQAAGDQRLLISMSKNETREPAAAAALPPRPAGAIASRAKLKITAMYASPLFYIPKRLELDGGRSGSKDGSPRVRGAGALKQPKTEPLANTEKVEQPAAPAVDACTQQPAVAAADNSPPVAAVKIEHPAGWRPLATGPDAEGLPTTGKAAK